MNLQILLGILKDWIKVNSEYIRGKVIGFLTLYNEENEE